ncbi:signal peptidase I [Enterococcus sp. RIT-PI-f]|uniref:signal peptidase I n=1 Tax=Enterococcus sp. RIT-PI-f TaxID=1690244 RepID=UPI0006BA0A6D|nr:signal peptidase I [Enterococcus sp. RIT-PI-f]KPG73303.1 signal peptidase I [Enterococcus sp. RIT-PI-f]
MKELLKTLGFIAIFALFLFLLRQYVFTPVIVKGDSMDPTLHDGERVIALKQTEIERFDIITFIAPDDTGRNYIKRVIGLPGDQVVYQNDTLYINGTAYDEPYLEAYKTTLDDGFPLTDDFDMSLFNETEVPEGKLLVLGDNRRISKDSRQLGLIDETAVLGDVAFVFWPLADFGRLEND